MKVAHYVGTGWELLGFPALRIARSRNSAFTVWPAVHPGQWGDSPLDVAFYNQTDGVFAQTEYEREHLVRLGVRPELIHVCGLAPATVALGDSRRFREAHGIGSRPMVLFVGRKTVSKGYHALCSAFQLLLKRMPDALLVSIGPAQEPPFPSVPQENHFDLGVASDEQKADALAACDVFCMPSNAEAFGIAYVEAWQYGKPVIAGTAPAVQQIVEEGVDGYCVAQEPAAIADAIIELLLDPELSAKLGARGYAKQQQLYTWERVAQNHLDVFTAVCRERA